MKTIPTSPPPATHPCLVCPHHCAPPPGGRGLCRARVAQGGRLASESYGRVTSLALDPIEKKPLRHFHPGALVLSVGSYGCNLRCPFCQNHDIAQCTAPPSVMEITPDELAGRALSLRPRGNIGLAFTYNEPAVGYEYVRDASRAAKARGLANVMVTNGFFCQAILEQLLESVDAFNIDLKCFTEEGYRRLGGQLDVVQNTILRAAATAHVEVTTLVVPGLSDDEDDMARQAAWLASISPGLPLHISRYFPRWRAEAPATPRDKLRRLAEVARRHLRQVHLGNI